MLQGQRDSTSGAHVSIWTRSAETPKLPMLVHDIRVDVCVVGAGMAGLSVAYELARQGISVAVVDDGAIGSGETGRTTAHLASAVDDHYHVLESIHGEEVARIVAESHSAAIDRIEAIASSEGIDCGFRRVDGYLFTQPGEDPDILDKEFAAAHRAGLVVYRAEKAPMPGFHAGPALRFPDQAQFHPLRYLTGLAEAAMRHGAALYTGGHASEILGGRDAGVTLHSGKHIRAGAVVVATNVPVNDRLALHTKLEPHRTYVIAAKIPSGSVARALVWDTGEPYHYVRVVEDAENDPEHDLLVVGGEDHPTGQAVDYDRRYAELEAWMRKRYPGAREVYARWSGQIIETVDGLAYIGRNPGTEDNVYIVTGDSGNGITHGAIAGMILPDLIQGKAHPWAAAYRPGRLPPKAAGELTRHNLRVAVRYADWIKAGSAKEEEDILPGQGAVVKHLLRPVAAYRDEEGRLHHMSAVCPHLKCEVGWNDSEKTWDCPCHGSRFDRRGHVINGPANRDLTHLHEPEGHPAPRAGDGGGTI
ncbi:MAG TPA: FAD-dependent oxidoreductase [Fibrobacteria bacterium]|nr:FAD-dependent oxidoreductase [Fibrobacteria bacterium]